MDRGTGWITMDNVYPLNDTHSSLHILDQCTCTPAGAPPPAKSESSSSLLLTSQLGGGAIISTILVTPPALVSIHMLIN